MILIFLRSLVIVIVQNVRQAWYKFNQMFHKSPKARKAILETKLAILAIEQQWAVEGEGAEDNTPQHGCISTIADPFHDFENGTQKIVDIDLNHERSLQFEHVIQNVIVPYKQLYQESVTNLTNENDIVFQANDRW